MESSVASARNAVLVLIRNEGFSVRYFSNETSMKCIVNLRSIDCQFSECNPQLKSHSYAPRFCLSLHSKRIMVPYLLHLVRTLSYIYAMVNKTSGKSPELMEQIDPLLSECITIVFVDVTLTVTET